VTRLAWRRLSLIEAVSGSRTGDTAAELCNRNDSSACEAHSAAIRRRHSSLQVSRPERKSAVTARNHLISARTTAAMYSSSSRKTSLPAGARVLEVAPGPGYLAIEIAKRGDFRVSGLDISQSFVRIARDNARAQGLAIDFQYGNASQMPYPDESFDFVVCQAAFKNFSDPLGALDEIYRVLAMGGRASIYDLRKEASLEDVDAEVKNMHLSRVSALWTRWTFRSFLLKNAYTKDALERLVEQSRFGRGELRRDGIGFELRLAKPPTPLYGPARSV
jgi:ubiquinone/menaquinone biosynthesis C-methylase UbiE